MSLAGGRRKMAGAALEDTPCAQGRAGKFLSGRAVASKHLCVLHSPAQAVAMQLVRSRKPWGPLELLDARGLGTL